MKSKQLLSILAVLLLFQNAYPIETGLSKNTAEAAKIVLAAFICSSIAFAGVLGFSTLYNFCARKYVNYKRNQDRNRTDARPIVESMPIPFRNLDFSLDQYKLIKSVAYEKMPNDIENCSTLKEIKKLLRQKESECIDNIGKYYKIDQQKIDAFKAQLKVIKKRHYDEILTLTRSNVHHDQCNQLEFMKGRLATHKINPFAVDLIRTNSEAMIGTPSCYLCKDGWSHQHPAIWWPKSELEEKIYEWTDHEIIHLKEAHVAQRHALNYFLPFFCNPRNKLVKHWERIQELIAELLLIIENPRLIPGRINFYCKKYTKERKTFIQSHEPAQLKWIKNLKNKDRNQLEAFPWNQSPADAVHPTRFEILPWIFKIQELHEPKLQ